MFLSHWRGRNDRQKSCRLHVEALEDRTLLSTFSVLNTNNSGPDSLRQAILDANAAVGADLITFNIGGGGVQTISPTSALPSITGPVTIDGTTQPGFAGSPIIELNGAGAGVAEGFFISAGNSTVRGLAINRFSVNAIALVGNGGNVVEGNYLGTDLTGNVALGNGGSGVVIYNGSSSNRIGTNGDGVADSAERNVISGNLVHGIQVFNAGADLNVVAGNYIGTNASGTAALGNRLYGVAFTNAVRFNRIGTDGNGVADSAERNVISGNGLDGIIIADLGTDQNVVAGNLIGTDVTGTIALGNLLSGVVIGNGSQRNQIGGPSSALGNTIAFNRLQGVVVQGAGTSGNRIQGNAIFANGGLGIDLDGDGLPLPNDAGDPDSGPNQGQNFPLLSTAFGGASTRVLGSVNCLANTTLTLDFYASGTADPSGYGGGQRYLGSATVTTDGSGNASFDVVLAAATTGSEVVSATATDAAGNTSEFSAVVGVTNAAPTASITGPANGVRGQTRTFTLSATDPAPADQAAGFVYDIAWNDGSPSQTISCTPGNGSGVAVDHVFAQTGTYTVQVTAADQGGAVSTQATFTIQITAVALQVDACDPTKLALVIGGTTGDDRIAIRRPGHEHEADDDDNDECASPWHGNVVVKVNGGVLGTFRPTGRIVVYGQAGDDRIRVAGSIGYSAWLYGDAGQDRLHGGAGDDVLLGGSGDDDLRGGQGWDLLIGGLGADDLVGNADGDLLIAGTTAFDANEQALCAVMSEWTSLRSYVTRIANLRGTGSGPRANGAFLLKADGPSVTVFDDREKDRLIGSSKQDWFFANVNGGVLDHSGHVLGSEFMDDID